MREDEQSGCGERVLLEKLRFGLKTGVKGQMVFRCLFFILNRNQELVFVYKLSLLELKEKQKEHS